MWVNIQKAIENGHLQLIFPLKLVIFHSYVSLREGIMWVKHGKLVGGDWNHGILNDCPYYIIGNFIIPTDELIFFRGVGIPPTSKTMP